MKYLLITALVFSTLFGLAVPRKASAGGPSPVQTGTPAPSPSPSPTPDEELNAAKREAALAEERQKKAKAEQGETEAERAKLKAELGPLKDPSVSVPTGGVTTDQAGFVEVQMLAQEAARDITASLSGVLCKGRPVKVNTLVVYNGTDITALALYASMLEQLKKFAEEFETKEGETEVVLKTTVPTATPTPTSVAPTGASADPLSLAIAAPAVATGLVKSVAELVNLFRTDTEFKNKNVVIPEDMVISYLVQTINEGFTSPDGTTTVTCADKPAVYYPNLFPPKLLTTSAGSNLLTQLNTLSAAKNTAANNIKRIDARVKLITGIAAALKKQEEQSLALADATADRAAKEAALKKLGGVKCKTPRCKKLNDDIDALDTRIDGLNVELRKTGRDLNELTGGKPLVAGFAQKQEGWVATLNDLKAKTRFLIDAAEQITSKLNTPDETTKLTALAQLLRAERLASILEKPGAYTLRVSVAANGTTKIKKNLFVDAKVRHSAGANLVYQLFDKDGRVVMGDAMQFYYDYSSSSDVRSEVSGRKQARSAKGQNGSKLAENAGDK